jgi:hypothetical protein
MGSASILYVSANIYRGFIGSVLEYGSVCSSEMAKTHMLLLERIQYRALIISMGLMGSTPNNSLGVLSGIPPLRHRMFFLNFRYLVNIFQKNGHPLRNKLEKLNDLSPKKHVSYRFLRPVGWIFNMKSATRDMS